METFFILHTRVAQTRMHTQVGLINLCLASPCSSHLRVRAGERVAAFLHVLHPAHRGGRQGKARLGGRSRRGESGTGSRGTGGKVARGNLNKTVVVR